jgi:hypothetical protein
MRLHTTFCIVAACASLGSGCGVAEAQRRMPVRDEQTFTRTLRADVSGDRTLDIRTINGSIHITAADIQDVDIVARRVIRARSDDDVRAAEREVTIEFLDGPARFGAVVRDDGHTCGDRLERSTWRRDYDVAVDFTIRVPRRTHLQLCTINGGEIRVAGTDGDFDIHNINGPIELDSVRGAGSVETINGDLTVSFADVPRGSSRFKTLNGEVSATFPANLAADLALKTRNGELLTDFDVEVLPQPVATAERRNGRFVYRSDGSARVRVGKGGPEIALETFNGDVRVLKERR